MPDSDPNGVTDASQGCQPLARGAALLPGPNGATRRSLRHRLLPALLLYALLCVIGPASAHVWTEVEEAFGRLALQEMETRQGFIKDPLLQTWVDGVGHRLAEESSRVHLRFRFLILNTSESNAFSLPGGYIVVTSGLLSQVVSDEELAGVIGHEVAHADDHDFLRLLERQFMHIGIQSLLRREVNNEWIFGAQIVQLLDSMRASRRQEMQADVAGVKLTFAAGYVPEGHLSFLRTVQQQQHGLDALLASHPPGQERVKTAGRVIEELQRENYEGLMMVGDSLRERHHLAQAAEQYARAAELHPAQAMPLLRLGEVQEARARWPEARAAYEQALQRDPASAMAKAALKRLAQSQPPEPQPVQLPEDLRASIQTTLAAANEQEQALWQEEKRLHGFLLEYERDRQIANAVQIAQVIAPETNDRAYMSTVARAYFVLARAQSEARRQGELLARTGSVRAGWQRVGTELRREYKVTTPATANMERLGTAARRYVAEAQPALQAATERLTADLQVVRELTSATRLLSAAFLGLLASGPDQPLGRLSYTRFLLLQGDVLAAESRIRKVERQSDLALREVMRQHLGIMDLGLTTMHATAGPELALLDRQLAAQRLQVPVENLTPDEPLGQTVMTALAVAVPDDKLLGLQTQDTVGRMIYLDLRRERP